MTARIRMSQSLRVIVSSFILACSVATAEQAGSRHFGDWPAGKDPVAVGTRLAENFLPRRFRCETVPEKASIGIIYPEVITWYGALTFAAEARNAALRDRLVAKFDGLLEPAHAAWINRSAHVDFRVFGALPLEVFLQTKRGPLKELGLEFADAQWRDPTPDGITREARYWIDDMYMITLVQAQAFRATGDARYTDRAALAMCAYLKRLQEANGLFHHGEDSPFFWGRGNGWMAAGSAELLRVLAEDHPRRAEILAGYRRMMATLLATQGEDGLWRQLVDRPAAWPETSGSAMFAFAMVTGVKEGWLDEETYGPAARKAWLALVALLDADANLREVCIGTNKGFDEPFYLSRPRASGDLHGQAPMLWTATALLRRGK